MKVQIVDVTRRGSKARPLNGGRVKFEIGGGDFRLVAASQFEAQILWVKFLGTHAEYDRVDVMTVSQF